METIRSPIRNPSVKKPSSSDAKLFKPCAKRHGACGSRPSGPWPRKHAWRGSGRTRTRGEVSTGLPAARREIGRTYGLVLDLLGLAALECDPVALVLETLGGDQTLDLGSLGVGLRALLLGLDLATDDVLADLYPGEDVIISPEIPCFESHSSHSLPALLDFHHRSHRVGEDGIV